MTNPNNTNDSIFQTPASSDNTPADAGGENDQTNYLEALVGEGKKYKSADELAKAYAHLDNFTERVKAENSGLRTELGSKVSLEELVNRLSQAATPANPNGASNQNANNDFGERHDNGGGNDGHKGLSAAEVAELVRKSITEEQTKATYASNRDKCVDEMRKAWGPNYVEQLHRVRRELGVSENDLNSLAMTSPNVFLNAVLGSARGTSMDNPNAGIAPRSSTNLAAGAMRQAGSAKEDWQYFEKLRKENPTKYWSPSVQNRMHELAMKGQLELK